MNLNIKVIRFGVTNSDLPWILGEYKKDNSNVVCTTFFYPENKDEFKKEMHKLKEQMLIELTGCFPIITRENKEIKKAYFLFKDAKFDNATDAYEVDEILEWMSNESSAV